ncbi:MAG: FliO/MopB family protein [Deltaproteobacteria bacterium]|nr:FliO/MopB family protein [Deltaproteobacteria bacterium]
MFPILLVAESLPVDPLLTAENTTVDFTWLFIKMILAMAIVCLAAFGVIKYLLPKARFVRNAKDSDIEILERYPLEPRKNLYLIKVKNKYSLIGSSESGLNALLQLEEDDFKSKEVD